MIEGRRRGLSIFDVVVGEVVCLKTGDQIPADGLFLNGHSLKVDEGSMTGESDRWLWLRARYFCWNEHCLG